MSSLGRVRRAVRRARRRYGDLPLTYLRSAYLAARHASAFGSVETYCMFVGNPRSGSTLVGSLLDAHPEIVIANELNALRFLHHRFGRRQIYGLILENSRRFTAAGREQFDYQYAVPGQWQGRFSSLRVIGDKRADGSIRWLRRDPTLVTATTKLGPSTRFVHVVRNPYDNIATLAKRRGVDVAKATRRYFSVCATVVFLKEAWGAENFMDVRHEDLVGDTAGVLERLCTFVGVESSPDYLQSCARIVFDSPRVTRHELEWDSSAIAAVETGIGGFDFLKGYSY